MGVHLIECYVPGLALEAGRYIDQALADAGRHILSGQSDSADPFPPENVLRWQVREIREGNTILAVEEIGANDWDLSFFSALSRRAEALLVAREDYRREERRGLAAFLFGQPVELATEGGMLPPIWAGQAAPFSGDNAYESLFADLCGTSSTRLNESRILMAEAWRVTPMRPPSATRADVLESWLFLPNVEEGVWRSSGAAASFTDWRWRSAVVRGTPFVTLRRQGGYDERQLRDLTKALPVPATALELRGERPFRWAEAYGGEVERRGEGKGLAELVRFLHRAAVYVGEAPGMLFGSGENVPPQP